jgi:hypothetical protein
MFRTDLVNMADQALQRAVQASWAPLAEAMAAHVSGADGRALRARLALTWAAVHGFCALRAEGTGGDLWNPEDRAQEVANDLIALIVAACAMPGDGG